MEKGNQDLLQQAIQVGSTATIPASDSSEAVLSDKQTLEIAIELEDRISKLKTQIEQIENDQKVGKESDRLIHAFSENELNAQINELEQEDDRAKSLERKLGIKWALSLTSKTLSMLLAVTPLLRYLKVLCFSKSRQPKGDLLESGSSWPLLLVSVLNNAVWTSFSFKEQKIELATVFVASLLLDTCSIAILLFFKPETKRIVEFVGIIILCQVFNFDMMSSMCCGMIGISCSLLLSLIPLSHIVSLTSFADLTSSQHLLILVTSRLCLLGCTLL